jgi:uracil-DNA glycosylase
VVNTVEILDESKSRRMSDLLSLIKQDTESEKISATRKGSSSDLGLVNHYKLHEVIPNKWFDWERRAEAPIVIIGQDWGPYSALLKFVEDYEKLKDAKDFSYDDFLFKTFSSRTEKFIVKAIDSTFQEKYATEFPKEGWNNFFFTMAVLFTRQGIHFRGNHNFDPERSYKVSYPYVTKQLDIVSPKIVIPLGNLGLRVANDYYDLGIKNIKISEYLKEIADVGYIKKEDTYILPNYHPAAHVDPKIQLKIWSKLWEVAELNKLKISDF